MPVTLSILSLSNSHNFAYYVNKFYQFFSELLWIQENEALQMAIICYLLIGCSL